MAHSTFPIDGMTCAHCEHAVHGALSLLVGVSDVQVSASEGLATVEHDDLFSAEEVPPAVAGVGYAVRA